MDLATPRAGPALQNAAVAAALLAERSGLADAAALDAICGAGAALALADAGLATLQGAALALTDEGRAAADAKSDAERRSSLHAAAASYYVDLIQDSDA